MSIGRVIDAIDMLPSDDLDLVLAAVARRRARGETAHEAARTSPTGAAARAKRYRERRAAEAAGASRSGVTVSVTDRDARHGESVTDRDGKRDADRDASRLASRPSRAHPQTDHLSICPDQRDSADQQPSRSHSAEIARADASRTSVTPTVTRDASRTAVDEADDLHHAIDTGAAERNRKAIVAAYRAHAPAVPRRVLSLAGRADDTAAMAGMSEVALPGILARFFGDRDMKAKGWPVGHLLANPAQWGETATGWKRDEGAPRVRPLEDEVPPWVLAEREREAEHG